MACFTCSCPSHIAGIVFVRRLDPECHRLFSKLANETPASPITSTFRHIDLGINSDVTAFSSFKSSLNAKYNTPATPTPVVIYTASTVIGTRSLSATGFYDYNPLTSEGFEIYTSVFVTTSCTPLTTTTPTLPPSPTGSICSPHIDHCK